MTKPLTPDAASAATAADMRGIIEALSAANGNVRSAAESLRINRRTLDRRIDQYGLRDWLTITYPRSGRQPTKRRT